MMILEEQEKWLRDYGAANIPGPATSNEKREKASCSAPLMATFKANFDATMEVG